MVIETDESKGDKSLEMIKKATSKLATRRSFLKAASATGLVAAMYTVPKFSSVHARPAYAAVTGAGVTVRKSFGHLDTEFGGDGIPNDDVAITEITGLPGGAVITLGLSATKRHTADPPTNNNDPNDPVFTAPTGIDDGTFGGRGLWNFSYFMEIVGGSLSFADCKFCVLYDFNPGANTVEADWGKIDINVWSELIAGNVPAATTLWEDSQNPTFAFLGDGPNVLITPPASTFSAFEDDGEYNFALLAKTNAGVEIGRASMKVITVDP